LLVGLIGRLVHERSVFVCLAGFKCAALGKDPGMIAGIISSTLLFVVIAIALVIGIIVWVVKKVV